MLQWVLCFILQYCPVAMPSCVFVSCAVCTVPLMLMAGWGLYRAHLGTTTYCIAIQGTGTHHTDCTPNTQGKSHSKLGTAEHTGFCAQCTGHKNDREYHTARNKYCINTPAQHTKAKNTCNRRSNPVMQDMNNMNSTLQDTGHSTHTQST